MTDATPEPRGRELRLRFAGECRDCGTTLAAGTHARWDPSSKAIRCLACPTTSPLRKSPPPASAHEGGDENGEPDWGAAGASAQRQFDEQQSRRFARLRARWVAVALLGVLGGIGGAIVAAVVHVQPALFVALGLALPVLRLLTTPQHIDAWATGAAGERAVGARLEELRSAGILTVHDRRVPGGRTNIDHIAVSAGGVFVIDTKNVAGKINPTRNSLRVAGRRRDTMVTGVQGQVRVVRDMLADQHLPPEAIRGVLCFTRAELPWFRPSPGEVALLNPRGLVRTLRRTGPLSREQVHHLATLLARRLPVA